MAARGRGRSRREATFAPRLPITFPQNSDLSKSAGCTKSRALDDAVEPAVHDRTAERKPPQSAFETPSSEAKCRYNTPLQSTGTPRDLPTSAAVVGSALFPHDRRMNVTTDATSSLLRSW